MIAALHFNENSNKLQRVIKCGERANEQQWQLTYPKYKKGEAVAKPVKDTPTFGTYVYYLSAKP